MTTSRTTSILSKPEGDAPIPLGTLGYFRARNKSRMYDFVLKEFQKSGITQVELSRRLSKRPEVVCRLLGAPGNWGLDTVSDLLFAISGAEADYSISYPLAGPPRNFQQPEWLQPIEATSVETPGTFINLSSNHSCAVVTNTSVTEVLNWQAK